MVTFFSEVLKTLTQHKEILSGVISNTDRKSVLDGLGTAGSDYRNSIYNSDFTGKKSTLSKSNILEFIETTQSYLQHTIVANKRADNMYHAYNLMTVENEDEVSISYLPEMLEGQVAVLSAGYLAPEEALSLLDGLKNSSLFREDQYSYILYPNKELPRFDKKNNIAADKIEQSQLLKQLVQHGNTQIIEKDVLGNYHFNGGFNNANSLKEALKNLPQDTYQELIEKETQLLLNIFEDNFDHKSFTGRSGTFFGYEGLGSIYWHMVSKLLLAVQENGLLAINNNESDAVIGKLLDHYYEINAGIGVHKSPELYGAFPTDPYSHTPATKGAQQPGMTGQVKEDVLSRFGELGVFVKNGTIDFNPRLLQIKEFLNQPEVFRYTAVNGNDEHIELENGSLCFTYCQVPVIYKLADKEGITVILNTSKTIDFEQLSLDHHTSDMLFKRTGDINQIIVSIKK